MDAILDAGFLAHVSFVVEGQPFVIPMLYGRAGETLYLHGAAASRIMTTLALGVRACASVTLVDGLVLARSAFHHSMNYRSVVAFGTAVPVTGAREKLIALRCLSEHLLPGRWADVRGPNKSELEATTVLAMHIEEASAKVRSGPPTTEPGRGAWASWAGVLPLGLTATGDPIADPPSAKVPLPDYLTDLSSAKTFAQPIETSGDLTSDPAARHCGRPSSAGAATSPKAHSEDS